MSKSIFNSKQFGVITFDSTSQALKAEKALQDNQYTFVMIPTPREISASCGLSVKTHPQDVISIRDDLIERGIIISGVYQLDKNSTQTRVQVIE